MGCGIAWEDGGVAGGGWLKKGQVENSASLDLWLPPGRPVGSVGRPTGDARAGIPSCSGERVSCLSDPQT